MLQAVVLSPNKPGLGEEQDYGAWRESKPGEGGEGGQAKVAEAAVLEDRNEVPSAQPKAAEDQVVEKKMRKLDTDTNATQEGLCLAERIAASSTFEMVFAGLIVLNTVNMCVEAEYRGWGVGDKQGFDGGQATTVAADLVFMVVGLIFSVVFTSEVIIKMAALRCKFWFSAWNVFDFFIIAIAWFSAGAKVDLPINPMLLRLFRLVRLLRLLRSLSAFEVFDNLNLMVRAIKSAAPVIIWVVLLVFPTLACCALAFNFILVDFIEDPSQKESVREECYLYWGTFTSATLTMFEVTFGNWVPVCRFLYGNVDERFAIFFMAYQLGMGIGVLRIVYGVFLHVTFECAHSDDSILVAQKNRENKRYADKMNAIFEKFDDSGDGVLTREEFQQIVHDDRVTTLLSAMDLEIHDPDLVFNLADDDGDGSITAEEMVKSFALLRGSARSLDVLLLNALTKQVMHKLNGTTPPPGRFH